MGFVRLCCLLLVLSLAACHRQGGSSLESTPAVPVQVSDSLAQEPLPPSSDKDPNFAGKGALLLTRFHSLAELKQVVEITYDRNSSQSAWVQLTHESGGRSVTSVLERGVSQEDFSQARDSGFWAKASLLVKSPYSVRKRKDLWRVFILARWRADMFGESDVAFFDLATSMMDHISPWDKSRQPARDFSEKGYINTFNHVTAQAFMTSLFSEKLADLVADSHERFAMPELITGVFSEEQLGDIENGPTDNYVDIVNNEWGQELGKVLQEKYQITRKTHWSPQLLQAYLNDLQGYFSWAFRIGFTPFQASDEIVIRFSAKLNTVMQDTPTVE